MIISSSLSKKLGLLELGGPELSNQIKVSMCGRQNVRYGITENLSPHRTKKATPPPREAESRVSDTVLYPGIRTFSFFFNQVSVVAIISFVCSCCVISDRSKFRFYLYCVRCCKIQKNHAQFSMYYR